ncbi:BolA family transcriptional regulator [Betaproteobacteria bacterium]|nr:BolA family transcriptional regulator [Betaproteobacteria bacterium]
MNNDKLISEVEELLSVCFNTSRIEIIDDSKNHLGHSGNTGGAHLNLEIVSVDFEGLSRIKRHKLIYKCLDGFIPGKIHALKVIALSPSEF